MPDVTLFEESDFKIYKFEEEDEFNITRDGNVWVVKGEQIEKLLKMTRFEESEGVERFSRKFKGMGIEDELERLGNWSIKSAKLSINLSNPSLQIALISKNSCLPFYNSFS